jgi:hypothetical protein
MNRKNKSPGPQAFVRFENHEQLDLIKQAAARRGLSVGRFLRLAGLRVAAEAIAAPPDPLLGEVRKNKRKAS